MDRDSLSLKTVHRNLLLPILMKLPNRELCRMRRTCSLFNDIAEENTLMLSKRSMFYTRVSFSKDSVHRFVGRHPGLSSMHRHLQDFDFNETVDYKRQMSGICVHLMDISGIWHFPTRNKLQTFFDELQPTVGTLYLEDLPVRAAMNLLAKVNFRSICVVKRMAGRNQPSTMEFIERMAQSPFHAKIGLHLERVKHEHVQLFTIFREIQSNCFDETFLWWIQEISSLDDVGHLKRICLECRYVEYPTFQMIWKADEHQFEQDRWPPRFVAQMDMKNHILYIVSVKGNGECHEINYLIFVSRSSTSKFIDILEAIEDISPDVHEQMTTLRSMLANARDDVEQLDSFKKIFDGLVKNGFCNLAPWISDNLPWSRVR